VLAGWPTTGRHLEVGFEPFGRKTGKRPEQNVDALRGREQEGGRASDLPGGAQTSYISPHAGSPNQDDCP
jgi:hypothetical protein